MSLKQIFIELAIKKQVLKFGEFTLKSGRKSPYFFNAGYFNSGEDLNILADCYANTLVDSEADFDMLFGPAYKGIPLAAVTALALNRNHQKSVGYCFNRKEKKDHGEGGSFVGAPLQGKVVIVDDVITAGTAIRESIDLIKQAGATPSGILIALDRQEKGKSELSAIQEIEREFSLPVYAIICLDDLVTYLSSHAELGKFKEAMLSYRTAYGVKQDGTR